MALFSYFINLDADQSPFLTWINFESKYQKPFDQHEIIVRWLCNVVFFFFGKYVMLCYPDSCLVSFLY